jgi:hypothetical protein
MLPSRLAIAVAVMAFALVPHGFLWPISGGGVTRSLGFTFAIMTVRQSVLMYRGASWRDAALTGLWCALAIVSHLEMAWFAATSCALVFTAYGRSRTGVLLTLVAGAAAMALSAPWWGQVMAHHGPAPFLAAATTGSAGANPLAPLVPLIQFRPTAEPLFPVIAALGVLGAIACIATRHWFLPLWLVCCAVFDPRAFATVACVPLALLAGIAVQSVLVPWISTGFVSILGDPPAGSGADGSPRRRVPGWLLPVAGSFAVIYGLLGALLSTPTLLTGLTDAEREAMAWVAHSTAPSAQVAVVSGDEWESDRTSEWLPALTGRVSVATVQGHEWMSDRDFDAWITSYDSLQSCGNAQVNCLEEWSASNNAKFDYVYVPRLAPRTERVPDDPLECCAALRAALLRDPGFRTVYDGPGATVFQPRDAAP